MFLILLLFLPIVGCESADRTTNNKIRSQAFPKALAAVWEGYYSQIHWVIKFTPDGRIEYAKMPFGGRFVGPNAEATFPMQGDNNTMVVKTGDFLADYKSDGTLGVSIEILDINSMTPSGRMEMKGTEYLIGDVDIDKGIWNAVWFTDGSYWLTPLGKNRVKLPEEYDGGKPLTLRRLIHKDSVNSSKNTKLD